MDGGRVVLACQPFDRDSRPRPFGLYEELRDQDPVHRSPAGLWVLSRFADVHAARCPPQDFSSAEGLTGTDERQALALAPTVVMMDPPEHTHDRRSLDRGFILRSVVPLEPEIRSFTQDLVAELRAAGTGDFATGIARRIPAWLVARYLCVPQADHCFLERWTEAIVQSGAGTLHDTAHALGDLDA